MTFPRLVEFVLKIPCRALRLNFRVCLSISGRSSARRSQETGILIEIVCFQGEEMKNLRNRKTTYSILLLSHLRPLLKSKWWPKSKDQKRNEYGRWGNCRTEHRGQAFSSERPTHSGKAWWPGFTFLTLGKDSRTVLFTSCSTRTLLSMSLSFQHLSWRRAT